ncbi:hypothetical protein QFC22_000156 [Naganishia vaughanmartiniae]|uniref:Uncharacterized protein n=1 Tax=Naganishia vaughanmartiniae TaxID=1424756 RepID=A0ACC2XPL7_9TREE|nr:hypothetical protein QFC22_000156 [Naganishia vaughanmartiniae]
MSCSAASLTKCNSTTLFEDNQANLEQAVEELSELLEKPIAPETIPQMRADVTNKTAFVQKRSDIILQDTLLGHWETTSDASVTAANIPTMENIPPSPSTSSVIT